MNKFVLVMTVLLSCSQVFAQSCTCESNFEWVKKTFEENDAGFESVLAKKGIQAYGEHNERILTKIRNAKNVTECTPVLYEWLEFFRSGHISIQLSEEVQKKETENKPLQDFSKWETFTIDLPTFQKDVKNKEIGIEGIWYTEPYKIGIKKKGTGYIGFIIESGADTWKKNQVKLRITENLSKSVFYMRDHSAVESEEIKFIGKNYLQLGNMLLKRVYPEVPKEESIDKYYAMLKAGKPYLEKLNDKTLMLRIPSFRQENKVAIDSVIAANKELLLTKENLIIDIRNGTGGSDSSFNEILPLIYSNPIRTVLTQFRSTKLNNQRMLDFINNPEYGFDEDEKKWAKKAYEKLEQNLGKYIGLNQYDVNMTTFDTVYPYPKNVGIIINKGNGSTDEQFLLAAKQSKKVKLFGTTTFGVLDISNMYYVASPCNDFKMGYALSKSKRIPGFAIDEIGIQPDFFMDAEIPEYEWVNYVNDILNNNEQ